MCDFNEHYFGKMKRKAKLLGRSSLPEYRNLMAELNSFRGVQGGLTGRGREKGRHLGPRLFQRKNREGTEAPVREGEWGGSPRTQHPLYGG